MAYLALARKWRPRSFEEVVGQPHVVKALSNALQGDRVHHAYLFTGTRGVGKTTLARIFAKSLNCETGTSAEPCQQCSACQAIDEGRYVDLIEVDAASRTKVDDTRELLENVQYAPTSGRFKVYLIDEVHMLSTHSFNALLKTLEEPPEHVKFLFATTDPQKLPVTVLSRCLQFNLRAMRPEQIENQLIKVLDSEQIDYELTAVQSLARAADGSMRDGLSLLDQAIAQGVDSVSEVDVVGMLGTIKAEHSVALLRALMESDADRIMQVVSDMAEYAVDFSAALDELLVQLYAISLRQIAPEAAAASSVDSSAIIEAAAQADAEQLQLYYQIGLHGKRDLSLAPSARIGFEMTLLRMLAFTPNDESSSVSEKISTTVRERQAKLGSSAIASAPQVDAQIPATPMPERSENAELAPVANRQGKTSRAQILAGQNEWGEMIEQTDLRGVARQLAMNCACENLDEQRIELALAEDMKFLLKDQRVADIQAALRVLRGDAIDVHIAVQPSENETPAECLQRLGFEQKTQLKSDFEQDPGVQALMSEFNATIVDDSIQPACQSVSNKASK